MPSPNLNITEVAASQTQKEVTINDAVNKLDLALTDFELIDLSAGNATVTAAQFRENILLRTTGNAVSRNLTVQAFKRMFAVQNGGSATLSIVLGTTTLSLPATGLGIYYTDGTANGLVAIASTAATTVTDLPQNLSLSGDISPAQITANQNDYNPAGLSTASVIRVDVDTTVRRITGLQGGADGRIMFLINITTNGTFVLSNADTGSTAANRFSFDADIRVGPGQAVGLQYDATASRWRSISVPRAARITLASYMSGVLTASQVVHGFLSPIDFVLENGAAGWRATAAAASTGTATLDIRKNGSSIGSVVFTASATGTFTFSADSTFVPGDLLEIVGPVSPDATLAGVRISILARRA